MQMLRNKLHLPRVAPTAVVIVMSGAAVLADGSFRPSGSRVQVRVYDISGQSWTDLTTALDVARQVLSVTRTTVVWRVCDRESVDGRRDNCVTRTAEEELVVRILRGPRSSQRIHKTALGHATIDGHSGTGVLATIYFDRVDKKAAQTNTSAPSLLGRTIAHELGHLLLGTSEHAVEGLMRSEWTPDELRIGRAADWSFTATEITAIESRAASRNFTSVTLAEMPRTRVRRLPR
jgi:hypothetical protein